MEDKITVLIIDDSLIDRELFKRLFNHNGFVGTILEADNVAQGLMLYRTNKIDCVLVDYQLPGENGIDFIEKAYSEPHSFVPIIMLTGHGSEKIAVEAMKAGAADYLTKDDLSERLLRKTIEHVLEKKKLVAELKEKTLALELMATTDSLTGLLNRRAFQQAAKIRLSESKRHQQPFAVLFIDLDNFKAVNDFHGHDIGDQLLSLAAQRLKACLREEDILCRFGGDEFVAICTAIHRDADAPAVAQKLIKSMSEPFSVEDQKLQIGASIGIAYSDTNKNLDRLLHEADLALYDAKREGKGKYAIAHE